MLHLQLRSRPYPGQIDTIEQWHQRPRKPCPRVEWPLAALVADTHEHAAVQREIEALDAELQRQGPRLSSLDDQLRFVADSLSRLDEIVACRHQTIYVDRLGIRQDNAAATNVHELRLAEIQVATKPPRVASLVSFPRGELLPERDFLREASLFLAA